MLHTDWLIEDGGSPYQLAKSNQAYICYETRQTKKGGESKRNYFKPVDGWLEVIQDYLDGDELSAIDSYLQVYSALYNRLDAISPKRPSADILLTLSACFSEAATYEYARTNLLLWLSRFERLIGLCKLQLIRGKTAGIATAIYECERTAGVGLDKILRYENIQTTTETIQQIIKSQANVSVLKRGSEILNRIDHSNGLSPRLLKMKQMAILMKDFSTLVKYLFSRIGDFDIRETRPEDEQKYRLYDYVERTKQSAKGLVQAELFRSFEITEESLNTDILPSLVEATDVIYQKIRPSFGYSCLPLDPHLIQDTEEILIMTGPNKKRAKSATNIGVFMFTDLDDSTIQFDPLTPFEISEIVAWYDNKMKHIIAQFDGERLRPEGDGSPIIFETERNALIAGITILQEISAADKDTDLPLLPMCIGITKGEYIQTGRDVQNHHGSMINWAKKLAGINPPGLYITEDLLSAVSTLKIPLSEFAAPESFRAFKQKIFSVQWNIVERGEII